MSKLLRPYQIEAIQAIRAGLEKGETKQLLVLPTGAGKTFTAIQAIKDLGRILWISHTEELIQQSLEALLKEFECQDYGIIKAEKFDIDKPVVMASAQTLHRRLDRIPTDWFDVIVCDEADLFGSKTFFKAIEYFTPKLRLGLTATPFRNDNMLMGDIFDTIIYEYPIERAISDGFLCELDAIKIQTSTSLDKVKTVAGELNQGDLEEVVNTLERNNLIVNKYLQYAKGRPFIAFCVDVKHAMDLCETFNEKGVKCNFVVGDKELTTNRKGVIEEFKNGDVLGITNCMILTAGFDFPNTGCLIAACPTKSKRKFLQQVGRGARLKDESFVSKFGQNCIILDIVDVTSKHRLVNTWELDRAKPPKERIFLTQEKKEILERAREAKFNAQQNVDERVILISLPKVKISKSIRMQEPATEKQLGIVKQLGYDIENTHYTKKHCSEIIGMLPVGKAKLAALKANNYDISNGVTLAEYGMAKQELAKKGIEIE